MFEKLMEILYGFKYRKVANAKREDVQDFIMHNQILPGKVLSFHINSAELICEINNKMYLFNVKVQRPLDKISFKTTSMYKNQMAFVHFHLLGLDNIYEVSLKSFGGKVIIPPSNGISTIPRKELKKRKTSSNFSHSPKERDITSHSEPLTTTSEIAHFPQSSLSPLNSDYEVV